MRSLFLSVCCVGLLLVAVSPASAQFAAPRQIEVLPRFAASVAIGVARPVDSGMAGVYGSNLMPVTAQVEFRTFSFLSMFGGVRWVSSDGQTVVVGPMAAGEQYPTSIRLISYRFGLLASTRPATRWSAAAGGGLSITAYDEKWPDAGLSVSGQSTGFVVLGEVRYDVTSRWSATMRVEYTAVPARIAAANADVNLGGVDVLGGLRFSF